MKIIPFEIEHYEINSSPFHWRDGLVGSRGEEAERYSCESKPMLTSMVLSV